MLSQKSLFSLLDYTTGGLREAEPEISMAAPPLQLPRRTRGGGSDSLFFITVAARQRQLPKKEN
jgi:hypothetical protein